MALELTTEQLQQLIDAEAKKNAPIPEVAAPIAPTPQPLELNIGGNKFSFNSQEALEASLNNTFQSYNTRLAEAETKAAQGSYITEDDTPAWNQEKFIELGQKDFRAALDYVDNFRFFDGKAKEGEVSKSIKDKLTRGEQAEQMLHVYQFRSAHPEYKADGQALQVLEHFRNQLGAPFTFDGMEAAYTLAVARGHGNVLVDPSRLPQQQQMLQNEQIPQNQNFGGYPPPPQAQSFPSNYQWQGNTYTPAPIAPPAMGRGASFPNQGGLDLSAVEAMDTDQIAKLIDRMKAGSR